MRYAHKYHRQVAAKDKAKGRVVELGGFPDSQIREYRLSFQTVPAKLKVGESYESAGWYTREDYSWRIRWNETIVRGLVSGFRSGHRHAPRWYRNMHESGFRAHIRDKLRTCLNNQDWDELALPGHPRDADWDWF